LRRPGSGVICSRRPSRHRAPGSFTPSSPPHPLLHAITVWPGGSIRPRAQWICSYPGFRPTTPPFLQGVPPKSRELELVPQGTSSETHAPVQPRASVGLFSAVFGGDQAREGKGRPGKIVAASCVREAAKGDLAPAQGNKAEPAGQSSLLSPARNFNPVMAMAARVDRG